MMSEEKLMPLARFANDLCGNYQHTIDALRLELDEEKCKANDRYDALASQSKLLDELAGALGSCKSDLGFMNNEMQFDWDRVKQALSSYRAYKSNEGK